MRSILVLTPESKKEPWALAARELYLDKISHFVKISWINSKTTSADRSNFEQKIRAEEEGLSKNLKPDDFIVLLDERGKSQSSEQFSKFVVQHLEAASSGRLVFLVGGAFGVSDAIRKRANFTLSLSSLVLAHPVAHVLLLEQIYRAFAIARNLPYHNS